MSSKGNEKSIYTTLCNMYFLEKKRAFHKVDKLLHTINI